MAKLIRIPGWVFLAALLYVPAVQAQGTDSDKNDLREHPVAPIPPLLASGGTSESALNPTAEVQAGDDRPLSGVQELTLGPKLGVRNFLVPSINVMSQVATSSSASGYDRPTALSYLLGTLDLNRVSERSELLLHYTGGGMMSTYLNSAIQDLEFSYTYKWRRWSLLVGDQTSYLSESPFGFGGVGGLAFLNGGVSVPFLNPSLDPNQTIPTIIAPRLSNTVVSQIEHKLSPRASWTASGSYGLLNFLGAGYINSTERALQTGYNYALSPQSSIAAIYRFDAFRFTYLPQRVVNHVMQLGYARYVTGRLSFHFAAGPSVELFRGFLTGSANRLSWAMDSSLDYRLDRTTLLLSYAHLLTAGSGVLVGARMSQVEAAMERKLNPRWQASTSLGYANNRNLVQTAASLGNEQYNSWYVAVRFNHQLRPGTSLFMSYGARVQAMNAAGCPTPNCGTNSIGHELSAGFNFGLRPMAFQ
ncbi:MAG: hypothetical protein WBB89_07680 [Candidatus Acidiferrum sp.]